MKELMELMKKKKEGGEMSPERQKAKLSVLGELRGIANDAIGKDIPSLKKVTVAAPSEKGLEEGLDAASEMVDGDEEMPESMKDESEEAMPMESEGEEVKMVADMAKKLSPEEKQKLIEMLQSEESHSSEMME